MSDSTLEIARGVSPIGDRSSKDVCGESFEFLSKDMALAIEEMIGLRNHHRSDVGSHRPLGGDQAFKQVDRAELVVVSDQEIERPRIRIVQEVERIGPAARKLGVQRQTNAHTVGALRLTSSETQTHRGPKGEAAENPRLGTLQIVDQEPEFLPGRSNIQALALSESMLALRLPCASKIEPQAGETLISESFVQGMNDLVVHRPAVQGVRMTGYESSETRCRLSYQRFEGEPVGGAQRKGLVRGRLRHGRTVGDRRQAIK